MLVLTMYVLTLLALTLLLLTLSLCAHVVNATYLTQSSIYIFVGNIWDELFRNLRKHERHSRTNISLRSNAFHVMRAGVVLPTYHG